MTTSGRRPRQPTPAPGDDDDPTSTGAAGEAGSSPGQAGTPSGRATSAAALGTLAPILSATGSQASTPEGERVDDSLGLDRYTRTVRRHIKPAVLVGILGLLVGFVINLLAPGSYRATAEVHIPAVPTKLVADLRLDDSDRWRPKEQSQDTDAALLRSGEVLVPVALKLAGDEGPDELRENRISLRVPPNTRVLRISFTANDPEYARRGAQTVAQEFIKARDDLLEKRATRLIGALWQERERAQRRLDGTQEGGARHAVVSQQIQTTDELLAELSKAAGGNTRLVQPARRPTEPLRDGQEIPPISGAAVGVLGGLGLGVVRERRRRVVFDRKDVLNATGRRSVDLSNIAVELQVTMAQRVLVTGAASRPVLALVAGAIRARLDQVGALTCQVVPAYSAVSGNTIRAAMTADLVIVVAERGFSRLRELRRIMHLLDRSKAEVVVFLARGGPS